MLLAVCLIKDLVVSYLVAYPPISNLGAAIYASYIT